MSTTISYIVISILQFTIYAVYVKEMLGLKRSVKWLPLCWLLAEVINYINGTFINNVVSNMIVGLGIYFAVAMFMCEGKWIKKLIMTVIFVVLSIFLEVLIAGIGTIIGIFDEEKINSSEYLKNVVLLLIQMFIFICVQIVSFFGVKKKEYDTTFKHSVWIFANSFACYVAMAVLCVKVVRDNSFSVYEVIVMCILVCVNFISYYFYNLSIERDKIFMEKEVYRKQAELYTEWYEGIKSAREEAASLRHDINNHITVLRSVAESENSDGVKLEKICEYIGGLNFNQKIAHTTDSGNILIDAMLDMKKSYAKAQDIEVTEDIKLPPDLRYNEQDFVIVFGNLLDNAIEGCLKNGGNVQNKIIVRMKYDNGNMRMLIKNTYDGSLDGQTGDLKKNLVIETSKRDKKIHGIGLSNVGRIVDKYNGNIIWTAKGKEFTANVCMFDFAER